MSLPLSVKIIPFPEIENAYLIISFYQKKDMPDFFVETVISFLYDAGHVAAEWEPKYGPIQLWYKCDKDAEGALPHYFYKHHNTATGSWSQLAVEREQLKENLVLGDYKHIFYVLKKWTENR